MQKPLGSEEACNPSNFALRLHFRATNFSSRPHLCFFSNPPGHNSHLCSPMFQTRACLASPQQITGTNNLRFFLLISIVRPHEVVSWLKRILKVELRAPLSTNCCMIHYILFTIIVRPSSVELSFEHPTTVAFLFNPVAGSVPPPQPKAPPMCYVGRESASPHGPPRASGLFDL